MDIGVKFHTLDIKTKKVADNTNIGILDALKHDKCQITAQLNVKDWMENIEFIVRSELTGDFYIGGWNSVSFLSSSIRASSTKELSP